MNSTTVFLADVALIVLTCMGIVAYVSKPLRTLLIELCGTADRASFWLAFSNVALVLVPLIFATGYEPGSDPGKNVAFEMALQLRYGLLGFVLTLSVLAIIVFRFIPGGKPRIDASGSR